MKKPTFSNKCIVAENNYWQAIKKDFIDSEGRKGDVITLKSSKDGNGTFILAFTLDKKIILNQDYKFGPDEFIYTLPSGFIETGLTGTENALQELQEETGYSTESPVIPLGKTMQNGYISGYNELFLVTNCIKKFEISTHEGEEIETHLVTINEFDDMLKNNLILDPYSEICYYRAKEKTNNFKNI